MQLVSVRIPNWDKFNARSDRANYTWFRFQNDFFHDQKIFGLSDSQVILFQFLLCEASKCNSSKFELNIEYVATLRQTTVSKIHSDLQALSARGVIAPSNSRLNDAKEPADLRHDSPLRTNERTNERECESGDSLPLAATIWNECVKSRPKVRAWNKSRARATRIVDVGKWQEACAKVEASDFLSGRNGKWSACGFDWLLKPPNLAKVLEGNYDNPVALSPLLSAGSMRGG